ncbi:TRM11 family SAM-dependent methyltransferase [Peribacillus sp. SCS-37]|uniref:TRM11 family SAM-dependent methyltransferase n=1 Tax=Paraperibacillus esterisolvens TaxID=3115296 RepID=UPI00390641B5
MEVKVKKVEYIYTYVAMEEERSLCELEMRSFFGPGEYTMVIKNDIRIDPSRSPFMKERIEIMFEGESWEDFLEPAKTLYTEEKTFKVQFAKIQDPGFKVSYEQRLHIERSIGWEMPGDADIKNPDILFGIVVYEGRWYFGRMEQSTAVWLHHLKKPREYSTALSTRVARAVANIAVPHPEGIKAIDPCCGIGTVLVEALSMGIDIDGRDINPLVTDGSRENIAYFGLAGNVTTGPISEVDKEYDVTIIDMPYNLYTHATPEDQLAILKHARRFSKKAVIVSIDTVDSMIKEAGFVIKDRCVARKANFARQVLVCE